MDRSDEAAAEIVARWGGAEPTRRPTGATIATKVMRVSLDYSRGVWTAVISVGLLQHVFVGTGTAPRPALDKAVDKLDAALDRAINDLAVLRAARHNV